MRPSKPKRPGRPKLRQPLYDTICGLLRDGKSVKYVMEATGAKKTKVYEIRQSIRQKSPRKPSQDGSEQP